MRAFHVVVFDDIVQNSSPVYSDPTHNALLGSADKLSFQVISNVFTGGPSLTVAVEHSADDKTWKPRLSTPELDRISLSWTDTNNHVVSYDSAGTVACRVRFRVELSASATVRVKITACGRSRTPRRLQFPDATEADSDCDGYSADDFWPIPGGDDVLLDEDTKQHLRLFEASCQPNDVVLAFARTELRCRAWLERHMRSFELPTVDPGCAPSEEHKLCLCSSARSIGEG